MIIKQNDYNKLELYLTNLLWANADFIHIVGEKRHTRSETVNSETLRAILQCFFI